LVTVVLVTVAGVIVTTGTTAGTVTVGVGPEVGTMVGVGRGVGGVAPAVPVPLMPTGTEPALVTKVNEALNNPVAVGEKVTLTFSCPPAASSPGVPVKEKLTGSLTVKPVTVTGAVPVLLKVACNVVVEPTGCEPKATPFAGSETRVP
jgi:hypothetical protein